MADKGIRPYCNRKFVELNEQRRRGLIGNTAFRKSVMCDIMEQFGITLASAATHYNHAFKLVKDLNNELVDGLGRAEDKKGGRKPKVKVEVVATAEVEVVVADELVPEGNEQQEFRVCKKADDSIVAEALSFEDARAMVQRNAAQKKAKLYWV